VTRVSKRSPTLAALMSDAHVAVGHRDSQGDHIVEIVALPGLLWIGLPLVPKFHFDPSRGDGLNDGLGVVGELYSSDLEA
jgi:hypothetical protein